MKTKKLKNKEQFRSESIQVLTDLSNFLESKYPTINTFIAINVFLHALEAGFKALIDEYGSGQEIRDCISESLEDLDAEIVQYLNRKQTDVERINIETK